MLLRYNQGSQWNLKYILVDTPNTYARYFFQHPPFFLLLKWFTNQNLFSIRSLHSEHALQDSVLVNPCVERTVSFPGVPWFVLSNTDFIPFNYACSKKSTYMARLPPLQKLVGGLGFWGKGRTKRRIVVGCRSVLLVCCSREHSMVSHNTVSFLLEVPGQKDWVCLQTWVRTVCITYVNMHMASLHHLMQ